MFISIIICLLVTRTFAQFNGDFWWLNPKLNEFRNRPSEPKFEDLSEFDTDESVRIHFRDGDSSIEQKKFKDYNFNKEKKSEERGKSEVNIYFKDKSKIVWPYKTKQENINKQSRGNKTEYSQDKRGEEDIKLPYDYDVLEFKFPDDNNLIWQENRAIITNKNKTVVVDLHTNVNYDSGKITFKTKTPLVVHSDVTTETESICTYMKKSECNRFHGIVYTKQESGSKGFSYDHRLICCVLPVLPKLQSSKIYFVENTKQLSRHKRSIQKDALDALKQRDALLLRKFGSTGYSSKLTTPNPSKPKIVTPSEDDIDPYWNIKSLHSKTPTKQNNKFHKKDTKYDYNSDEYVEDYVVEIPQPGLVGLYSDHRPSRPGWQYPYQNPGNYGGVDSDEEDIGTTFGYSATVDPRLDRLETTKPRISGRPVKFSTTSESRYDVESQTISYQANPDFQVLQGFKLLNLMRNKTKSIRNGKKTTTERINENDSIEHVLTGSSFENNYDEDMSDKNLPVRYKDCGKIVRNSNLNYENDDQIGDAPRGSHPWLALVVLTRRQQSFLCYAAIIHSRAAVTAGDCVFGRTSPGEITLISGAWRLNEEIRENWQKRMVSTQIHSQYKAGDLAHNLALLYWKQPLKFNTDVQPACLSEPQFGDDCKFFGWGGYDQAIKKQSRWQRASILTPRTCSKRISNKHVPSEAFCASVRSQGTVTGMGGPLICDVDGRQATAGVAVWRDHAVVLIPAQEWAQRQLAQILRP